MNVRLTVFGALATLLGSTVFYPLFTTGGWFWSGFGAILVVAATGVAARRLALPAAVAVIAQLALLIVYLTVRYVAHDAFALVIPTPHTLVHLAELARDGVVTADRYAPPVSVTRGISLLVTVGVGAAAIVVDLLAAQLRRAALTGLPLLTMFSVPVAASSHNVAWPLFIVAAAGYLALLVVEGRDRVVRWGRPVLSRRTDADRVADERPDARPLAAAGRRIGVAAVLAAVVLPIAAPGLDPSGLFGLGNGMPGSGHRASTVITPDPMINVRDQLTEPSSGTVLTYSSTDPDPDYLRMYVLNLAGTRHSADAPWKLVPIEAGRADRVSGRKLPAPSGTRGVPGPSVRTTISVNSNVHRMNLLPLPYPPTHVKIEGDWRADRRTLLVFSSNRTAGGETYTVTSRHLAPTRRELREAAPITDTKVAQYSKRPQVPHAIAALAARITRGATTPYDKAVAIQQWFTTPGRFTYSLNGPQDDSIPALQDFLLVHRTGFCEQFATSMALLARLEGIPARVAVGYTSGTMAAGGTWTVTARDAHAWPELYFPGAGWTRFEPTPTSGGQGTATVPGYAVPVSPVGPGRRGTVPTTAPTTGGASAGPTAPGQVHHQRLPGDTAGTATAQPRHSPAPWIALAIAVALLILAVPAMAHAALRRSRWPRPVPGSGDTQRQRGAARRARAAWLSLRDDMIDYGAGWSAMDSPRAVARRAQTWLSESDRAAKPGKAAEVTAARAALARIALAEERSRYAPEPGGGEGLADDARAVRAGLATVSPWRVRLRARLMPPSTTRAIGRGAQRILDVFGWLDLLGASLRRRITPRPRDG